MSQAGKRADTISCPAEVDTLNRQLRRQKTDRSKVQDEMDVLRAKARKVDEAEKQKAYFEKQIQMAKSKLEEMATLKSAAQEALAAKKKADTELSTLRQKIRRDQQAHERELERMRDERHDTQRQLTEVRRTAETKEREAEQLRRQLTTIQMQGGPAGMGLEAPASLGEDLFGDSDDTSLGASMAAADDLASGGAGVSEEMQARLDDLEKDNSDLKSKLSELRGVQDDARRLQLEVEELQHTKSEVRLWLAIRTCCSPHH